MSLRVKISLMLSAFFLLIAVFAAGTIMIFERLSDSIEALSTVSEENKKYSVLDRSVGDFIEATRSWVLTGDSRFKKQYFASVSDVTRSFDNILEISNGKEEIKSIRERFKQVLELSREVMDVNHPVGDPEVAMKLQRIEQEGLDIVTGIDNLQERSVNVVLNVARIARTVKKNMIYYHVSLIAVSSMIALFLIVRIRGAFSEPVKRLLEATERIGSGELSYRINMKSGDEFGVVSARFDKMAEDLEASDRKINLKLSETELFLEVARIAGTTIDLTDALSVIPETISSKLGYERCDIYMLQRDLDMFCLEASTRKAESADVNCIPVNEGIARDLVMGLTSFAIEDAERHEGDIIGPNEGYRALLATPIIRDNRCSGILVVRNSGPHVFSQDEVNTLKILAHTIGSVAMNADLYQSTQKQLKKLTVLYELSSSITSVLDIDELLKRIAGEITRLLSSKGCVIRMLEDRKLKIKSYMGLPRRVEDDPALSIGDGLSGWVAEKGESLLIADASKIPAGMRVPVLDANSVLCVPLRAGATVMGTLCLYDKYDSKGELVPFTHDDLNTAEGFASISSIAIEKSKIYSTEVNREKEASEAKKRLDILFDSVQGGIITVDREFNIISANRYIEDWIGLSGEELIGHNSLEIFHDKIGICPHCAAKATFETGEINSIMQSRGVNYAELTAYPIKNETGEIPECVVFIMDITERVLYQEETLSLYREVIQTKEYLESIINNSADAIVTTDLEGTITSWNQGADKTFGFSEKEVIGKIMPFVPDFLMDRERENIERIKTGEVLKDIETLRRKKDGTIIEVSLTLSPIKDAAGKVIGISGISRDISEKKTVEKELIRRNQELSRLFFISSAMRGTLDLDKLLRMVLIAVTMSDGMGFNRAILFLVDESRNVLRGAMGVGPSSPEEAWRIWDELSVQKKSLDDIMKEIISTPLKKDSFLDRLASGIEIPLDYDTVLTRAVKEKQPFNVSDVKEESLADAILIQQIGTQAYAIVPLISRDKVIGLIWVDNYFNRKQITDEDMKFLASFSNHVASAIENARLFEQVKMAEQQLENIFESMSDMVYFNNKDYVIQSINKAVSNKLGLPPSEIIGKKCYEVFHGTSEPYKKCPHHKTVNTKKAYIEELEDPYLGGTFLTSSSPIFDLTGEFIGSVHVVRDITEMKNLQEKLVMSEKMAALGEVAAKVAHEIRNPLVSVGGFAKRLEQKMDGNLKEYAGIIVKEVERLEGILKEILGFVKEVRLAKETVNINALLEDIITLMGSGSEDAGIIIVRDFGAPLEVFVDPNRVKEAIMNIFSNALQSLPGAGTISIKTYMKGKNAVVEIRDTGKGIPDSERQFIFNPFFTTKASGTGLGLAITHKIIQEHNGMIEVESEVDKGSTFRVYIPLKEVKI